MAGVSQRVIVCPLDWGLGHASRMIPVINRYRNSGYQVFIGGSGKSGTLLRNTFPDLPFIQVPSPNIRYTSKGPWLIPSLIFQIPALLISVFREHNQMKQIIKDYEIDVVVSDNRYGLYSKKAYCILITHQVSPTLPRAIRWAEYPLHFIIRSLMLRFHACWIPDFSHPLNNLSGRLSHRFRLPGNACYIGILSRFTNLADRSIDNPGKRYAMVIILSGPEPQRKIFLDLAISETKKMTGRVLIISGSVEKEELTVINEHHHIEVVPHLETDLFSQVLLQAGIIVCRSGYSGIMDLVTLGRTAILVPTPGQSEQEYLAEYLSQKGWFSFISQHAFSLEQVLKSNLNASCNTRPHLSGMEDFQVIPLSDKENGDHSQKSN
ncbi:MAG: hypothetical protein JXA72_13420 [Bacteroidales bacterium]|nr:hypothetical protein [Bacteroidales bacterium]